MVGTRGAADGTDDSVEVAELKRKLATLQREIVLGQEGASLLIGKYIPLHSILKVTVR